MTKPVWGMISPPNIASSSTTVFVSSANNINYGNNEYKTKIASDNIDKGKSILGKIGRAHV